MRTLLLALLLAAALPAAELAYQAGDTRCLGHLARPAQAAQPMPGVVVLPAWTGLDDHARRAADELAKLGYVALAADVYGDGKRTTGMEESAQWAGRFRSGDRALFRARIAAAVDALRAQPGVRGDAIAVIGYCFGGTGALEAARAGLPVRAVVSFHGGLGAGSAPAPATLGAAVLVLHGADDPLVPAEEVAAFQQEMRTAGADWQLVAYGNAKHSFTDPAAGDDRSKPFFHEPIAAQRAWAAATAFLAEQFAR